MRKYIVTGLVFAAVFGVGFWTHAQVIVPQVPAPPPGPRVLNVLSGDDVGFWVDHWEGDTPAGRWVVRRDGRWVEPKTIGGVRKLTH
jgi:hypothetical protein